MAPQVIPIGARRKRTGAPLCFGKTTNAATTLLTSPLSLISPTSSWPRGPGHYVDPIFKPYRLNVGSIGTLPCRPSLKDLSHRPAKLGVTLNNGNSVSCSLHSKSLSCLIVGERSLMDFALSIVAFVDKPKIFVRTTIVCVPHGEVECFVNSLQLPVLR